LKKINLPFIVVIFILQLIVVFIYRFFFFKFPKVEEKRIVSTFKVVNIKGKSVFLKDIKTKDKYLIKSKNVKEGDVLVLRGKLKNFSRSLNPGEFDEMKYYSLKGIKAKIIDFVIKKRKENKGIFLIKDFIKEVLRKKFDREKFLILNAIMWGESGNLPFNLKRMFYITGTPHLLAVSGLHMGMLAVIIFMILSLFLSRKLVFLITPVFLLAYSYLSNLSPSSLRASVMFSFIMLAFVSGRKIYPVVPLISSAFILILIRPFIVFDLSFMLSYLATFFIIYLVPVFNKYLKKVLPEFISLPVSVSFAAQFGIIPVLANYFHHISIISFIVNLFAVPLTGFIYTGLMFGFLSYFIPFLSNIFFSSVSLILTVLIYLLKVFSYDNFYIFIPSIGIPFVLSYYFFLLGLRRIKLIFISFVFFMSGILIPVFFKENYLMFPHSRRETVLLKVNNRNYIFGAGDKKVFDFLKIKGNRRIESIFITSSNSRHLSYFEEALNYFKVRKIFICKRLKKNNLLERIIYLIEEKNIHKVIFDKKIMLHRIEVSLLKNREYCSPVLEIEDKKFLVFASPVNLKQGYFIYLSPYFKIENTGRFAIINKYTKKGALKFEFKRKRWYLWQGNWKFIKLVEK